MADPRQPKHLPGRISTGFLSQAQERPVSGGRVQLPAGAIKDRTDPSAVGKAQRAGGAVRKQFQDLMAKEQDRADRAAVVGMSNEIGDMSFGLFEQASQRKLQDAANVTQDTVSEFDKSAQGVLSRATNQRQRDAINESMMRERSRLHRRLTHHENKEYYTLENQQASTQMAQSARNIAAEAADGHEGVGARIDFEIDKIADSLRSLGERDGHTDDMVDTRIATVVSGVHRSTAEHLMNQKQFDKAHEYLTAYGEDILDTELAELKVQLEKQTEDYQVTSVSDYIVQNFDKKSDGMEQINRTIKDAGLRRKIRSESSALYRQKKEAEDEAHNELFESVRDEVDKLSRGTDPGRRLPPEQWNALTTNEQSMLRRRNGYKELPVTALRSIKDNIDKGKVYEMLINKQINEKTTTKELADEIKNMSPSAQRFAYSEMKKLKDAASRGTKSKSLHVGAANGRIMEGYFSSGGTMDDPDEKNEYRIHSGIVFSEAQEIEKRTGTPLTGDDLMALSESIGKSKRREFDAGFWDRSSPIAEEDEFKKYADLTDAEAGRAIGRMRQLGVDGTRITKHLIQNISALQGIMSNTDRDGDEKEAASLLIRKIAKEHGGKQWQ